MIVRCTEHSFIRAKDRLGIERDKFLDFVKEELSECLMNTYQGTKRIITKSNAYFIMEVIDENTFMLKTIYERPHYLLDENSFGERHFSPKVVWNTDLCEGVN